MLYLLFGLLLFEIVIIYLVRRTLLSPSLWACFSYTISTIAAIIGNTFFWHIPIQFKAIIIVPLGIIMMFFGELVGRIFKDTHLTLNTRNSKIQRIKINKSLNITVFIFCLVVDLLFYRHNRSLGLSALEFNELAQKDTAIIPFYLLLLTRFVLGIGYVYTFIISNNIVFRIITKERDNVTKRYLPTLAATLICQILYASRGNILGGFLLFVSSALIMIYKTKSAHIVRQAIKKYSKVLFRVGIGISILFIGMGVFMGKFGKGITLVNQVLTYISGGVASFSLWMDQFDLRSKSIIFESFYGVYSLLNHFGFHFDIGKTYDVYVRWEGNMVFSSNIHGGFKPFYSDMGFGGVIVICFVLGIIYSILMKAATYKKSSIKTTFVSLLFLYPLFFIPFSCPTKALMTLATLSQILINYLVACVIFQSSKKNNYSVFIYNIKQIRGLWIK